MIAHSNRSAGAALLGPPERLKAPPGETAMPALTPGPTPTANRPALLLSAPEAAALSGVSVRAWWRWDASGRVPRAVALGRLKRWRRVELEAWIEGGCPRRDEWEKTRRFTPQAQKLALTSSATRALIEPRN